MQYTDLRLPSYMRKKLKEPLGDLVSSVDELDISSEIIICVGDKITENILEAGVKPRICVYDGRIMRKPVQIPDVIKDFDQREIRIKNPAGSLTKEAFTAMQDALKSKSATKIRVDGEEDLITLVAITLAPEGSVVLYGQPGEGVVVVKVDEEKKAYARDILNEMR